MKIILLIIGIGISGLLTTVQAQKADTNYLIRVTAVEWLPSGEKLLLTLVKFHKTNRQVSPESRVFIYDLGSNQFSPSLSNATSIAPAPDGKTIAYFKRNDDRKETIYLYNLVKKQETALRTDTFKKFSLSWSPDGNKLTYNISYNGTGQHSTIDVCIVDIHSGLVKQITHSGKHKSYNPVWGPDGKHIVYYLEMGDQHDQIYLTDSAGSFHRNLTNDTSTHNYYPSWVDQKTILYTLSPESIVTIETDGSNKKKLDSIKSYRAVYNPIVHKLAFISIPPEHNVSIYDWKRNSLKIIADIKILGRLF